MTTFATGTVTVENGSNAVDLNDALVAGNVSVRDIFVATATPNIPYVVAGLGSADSPPAPARFYLAANYAGVTDAEAAFMVGRDFTPNYALPLVQPGDKGPWAVQAEAVLRTDAALAALADAIEEADTGLGGLEGAVEDLETDVAALQDAVTGLEVDVSYLGSDVGALQAALINDSDWANWTPALAAVTPGDLSIDYASVRGRWRRRGNTVSLRFSITFTPTFSTASGRLDITGHPHSPPLSGDNGGSWLGVVSVAGIGNAGPAFGTGITQLVSLISPAAFAMQGAGSAATLRNLAITDFVSGDEYQIAGYVEFGL